MLFRSNDTATTEIYTVSYTLSLHDALPISGDGIEHVETNARSDRSLRFVQIALLSSDLRMPPSEQRIDLPSRRKQGVELILRLPEAALYLARLSPRLPARVPLSNRAHLFVTRGAASLGAESTPGSRLAAGDANDVPMRDRKSTRLNSSHS